MDSFAALINKKILIPSQKVNYIAVETHFLARALRKYTATIYVDEEWYYRKYPDIQGALEAGLIASAREHYQLYGFFEHRMPYDILVEEAWYLDQYPDIKRAVDGQAFLSGQQHFEQLGYKEGRIPYAGFSLRETAAEMAELADGL